MALKRKRSAAVVEEVPTAKRQLRSGRSIQISNPTQLDNPALRRAQLKSPPQNASAESKEALDLFGSDIEDSESECSPISPFRTRPSTKANRTSSHVDEDVDDSRALSDETNVPQRPAKKASKKDASISNPRKPRGQRPKSSMTKPSPPDNNICADYHTSSSMHSVAELIQITSNDSSNPNPQLTRYGNAAVEVLISTPLKEGNRPSTRRIPVSTPAASPPREPRSSINESVLPQAVSRPIEITGISGALPGHLHSCLNAQKRAIMRSLQSPSQTPVDPEPEPSVNNIAARQLADLVDGTVGRAEGNSCLLLGPRGSGKSQMIENCLHNLSSEPIILRLSGWVQNTDRHALREIAFQLFQQTGSSLLSDLENEPSASVPEINPADENPFLDVRDDSIRDAGDSALSLPPSSQLHALIPALLTLRRPVIMILDAFDLFALHPRQSLLYCLLDTVQNCRASSKSRGIAVIGVTSRVDTIQLLEKRVKSRFSGRTIRTAPPSNLQNCLAFIRSTLLPLALEDDTGHNEEWIQRWTASVENFLADKDVLGIFKDTFSLSRDLKVINRILTSSVLRLNPDQPYLSYKIVANSVEVQRSRLPNLRLTNLSYPSTCLLIASVHINTGGHPTFTFEMLFDTFRNQVRASMSAPVQVNGGSIGMVRCTREVLMSAFEGLTAAKIFAPVAGPSNMSKEFLKHRCILDRDVVKKTVEKSGQVNLKKWLNKAQ